jgi:hypothetical protein
VAAPPGEAEAFVKLATAGVCGCSCFVLLGSRSLGGCLESDADEPECCFTGGLGAGPEATRPWDTLVPGVGDLLSRVVLDRPRSAGLGDFCGTRWEVERSRVGVVGAGGVGAGR